MKLRALALVIGTVAVSTTAFAASQFKNQEDKLSYAFGLQMGQNVKAQSLKITPDAFSDGFKAGMGEGKALMTKDEARQVIIAYQKEQMKKQEAALKATAEANKKSGDDFLAKNKTVKGVVAKNGIQYDVIKPGKGEKPLVTDKVTVNYEGCLVKNLSENWKQEIKKPEGKWCSSPFDSSYARKEPATFPVNGVIKGWQEALPLMRTGAIWEVVVPAKLAYGEQGIPGSPIGPNETLIFKVDLMKIAKEDAKKETAKKAG
ncbi:FKBP-type peptidyl-prolyl cis-trans isomerase [Piscirickettsia litoralis]|uniref:Peptidyl-prolyl cis-trans isomerase n=1 Tax=Piscirickettsia litoralis TaxID=1891921 RepID=A0ABX3A405_9GAMM|nr:FKBP-type peptidyl-prolyl cis-trans isomerase [Piscirickettsia litoralis]ODN43591.1 peptidylprolyl isomerase [Piscirickettsia litoralis]